jgi:predicted RNA-binding Zn-ribbon protein involved in translation (DUF1610 family)
MILLVNIVLNDIFELGRDFIWPRPEKCPRCGNHKVWGHGFVQALFDGFDVPLLLKRYRCPDCGCVITMRPDTHFSRFQASIETIRSSLSGKIEEKKWLPGILKSRQRYWFNNLKKNIAAYLTNSWDKGIMAAFDYFHKKDKTPVSSSI